MNENDEKGINREEGNEGEDKVELGLRGESQEDNDTIEDLLSALDLPGDKDIDRTVSGDTSFFDEDEDEEELSEDGDTSIGEPLSKSEYHRANPTVDYNRPTLKTDKVKRVTKDAIDSLFKDLDMVMSGKKPSKESPILGKELEAEKKVSDLAKEDLQIDDKLIDKEPFSYNKDDENNDSEDIEDEKAFEELPSDKDVDLVDIEWPEEDEFSFDDIDIKDSKIEDGKELNNDKVSEELSDQDIEGEPKADLLEEDIQGIGLSEEGTTGDISDIDSAIGDGEELSDQDIEEEPKADLLEEDIQGIGLSEEGTIGDISDIDSAIGDEDFSPPLGDSIDKIVPDVETGSTIEDSKASLEFDDFDSYVRDEETKMGEDIEENPVLEDKGIIEEKSDIKATKEDVESMFTDITPLEDEQQDKDSTEDNLTEGYDEEVEVLDETEGLESIDLEGIEEETIPTDPVLDKESADISMNNISPTDDSPISDAQSLIDSIAEPEITEDAEESITALEELEPTEKESDTSYPTDLPIMESPPEEEEKQEDKQGGREEWQEESFDSIVLEEREEVSSESIEGLKDLDGLDSDREEIREETREKVSVASENKEIEFTNNEIRLIQENLSKLPQPLRDITTDIIVKEKLPHEDIKDITQALILGSKPAAIKQMLEDKLNINIKVKKDDTTKLLEKEEKSNSLFRFVASFIFIIILLIPVWFFVVKPYVDTENKYKAGLADIQKGENHYSNAISKFVDAKGNSEGDRKWYILYAQAFLKQGNPKAYYYAHTFLVKDDAKNKIFLQKYHIEKQKNNKEKEATRENPGEETKKTNSPIVSNPIANGIIDYLPKDKEALLILAESYIKKAIWIANNKDTINNKINWDDVDYYLDKTINDIYQPLAELDQNDQSIIDKEARTYMLWAELLQNVKPETKEQKLKIAENNYNKILTEDPNSPTGLYGLLLLYLTKEEMEGTNEKLTITINSIQKAIEKLQVDVIDEEVLSKFAFYLLQKQNKIKKAKEILNNVIRKGKIYPKAYYYLGLVYNKERDIEKSLESYIKGIFAFYYLKIGEEKFFSRISKASSKFERTNIMNGEMLNAINTVIKDTDPVNSQIQSMLFNKIGENILKLSYDLRENVEEERKEQKHIIHIAQKSFLLSLQKEPSNHKPWKNIGDIAYFEAIQQTGFFLENLSTKQINKFDTLYKLKELNQFKKAKYYYNNTLKLMVTNKYIDTSENTKETYLWKNLLNAVKNNKIDPDLFYKLGFIFYQENDYKQASQIWHSIKTIPTLKFNPSLNFALGNAYLRNQDHGEARRHYQNSIDFYKTIAERYINSPNPYSKRQNEVFAKLAKNHNNMGVSLHIMGEKLNNYKLKEYARLHYFQAREYGSKLNNDTLIAKELWNQNILNKNYIALANYNIPLKERLQKKQERKQTKKIQNINSINPLDHMLIENMEYILK